MECETLAQFLRLNEDYEDDGDETLLKPSQPVGVPGVALPQQVTNQKPSFASVPSPHKNTIKDIKSGKAHDAGEELGDARLQGVKVTDSELTELLKDLGLSGNDADELANSLGANQKDAEKVSGKEEKEGKKKKGVDDDFFAQDSDEDEEGEDRKSKKERSKSKNGKKGGRDETENGSDSETEIDSRRPATEAELELLVAPDDTQDSGGIHNHFDMKSIIKAEKTKGKSKKFKNKKRNKQGEEEELQEDFQIDVKDDRFKALHEDHTFAIDPSNPQSKDDDFDTPSRAMRLLVGVKNPAS